MSFVKLEGNGKCEDIEAERRSASFDVEEMTNLLDDGPEATLQRRTIQDLFIKNERFKVEYDPYSLTLDEIYYKALELSIGVNDVVAENDLPGQVPGNTQDIRSAYITSAGSPLENPMIVHLLLFGHTIMSQGTDEQQRKWLPMIRSNKIIGSYAQTELGHGTYMKGLETTATYDPKTEEFILNSPTITSIKFWPGGLGRTCNFAVVAAQLYTQNQHHGIHYFMVQVRRFEDHSQVPGITLGVVGPKMGFNAADNGFIRFHDMRIGRNQMLMKHAKVLKDGTYVKPAERHSGYATLVIARVGVVFESPMRLAQAVTIAVRYSAVRRQGMINPDSKEVQILDYKAQQFKILPHVAVAYGMLFTFKALRQLFLQVLVDPSPEQGAELHAISAGLKALSAETSAYGVEQCRLACGGLGYLQASRLPYLYANLTAACTYDGENTILLLQTARYLIKSIKNARAGNELCASVQYLTEVDRMSFGTLQTFEDVNVLYKITSARLISDLCDQLEHETNLGLQPETAWNSKHITLTKCARIHCQGYMMQTLGNMLNEISVTDSVHLVLTRLFELLGIYWITQNAGDFIRYGGLSHENFDYINDRLAVLLGELRLDAVAIVDSFDFRDEALHSILGCYDGRVYERVYKYVQQLPANQAEAEETLKQLRPKLLKSNL